MHHGRHFFIESEVNIRTGFSKRQSWTAGPGRFFWVKLDQCQISFWSTLIVYEKYLRLASSLTLCHFCNPRPATCRFLGKLLHEQHNRRGIGVHWPQQGIVQYSTAQCSAAQHSIAPHSTVQYSTVQYSTVQYSTVQYSTVQYSTVQYSTVQYSMVVGLHFTRGGVGRGGVDLTVRPAQLESLKGMVQRSVLTAGACDRDQTWRQVGGRQPGVLPVRPAVHLHHRSAAAQNPQPGAGHVLAAVGAVPLLRDGHVR